MAGVASFVGGKLVSHEIGKLTKPISNSVDGARKWIDGDESEARGDERAEVERDLDHQRAKREAKYEQRRAKNAEQADKIRKKYGIGKYKGQEPGYKPSVGRGGSGGEWSCCTVQ